MSKNIKVLIACSLVLNILLIGFVIGNVSHRFSKGDSFRRKPPQLSAKLSPEKEKVLLDTMGKVRLANRDIRNQMKEVREKIYSAMSRIKFRGMQYRKDIALKAERSE